MIQYNGQHTIDFFSDVDDAGTLNTKNTWRDWHIVPSSKLYVVPAPVKTNIVQVPGSNKLIDLTEYLTGSPMFEARSGEWEFIVDLDFWGSSDEAYSYFIANIHGRKLYCELQDNPGIVYIGRFSVSGFESSSTYPILKISYTISPTIMKRGSINSNGNYNYSDEVIIQSVDIEDETGSVSNSYGL